MRAGESFNVAPVELVNVLKGDGATFFGLQQVGDFLPGLAALPLFPDEIRERLQPAVKSPPAAVIGSLD